jgi:DNA-binding LacI/PurR family transcriptional regulator
MDKLAYSINETARALSMGRTSIYSLIPTVASKFSSSAAAR